MSIESKSACYHEVCSMYTGDVTMTKVNGEVYNNSSITIENGKRYVIYQEADEVNNSPYESGTYGLYSYDQYQGFYRLVIAKFNNSDFVELQVVTTYDTITACPSGYDNAPDLSYPGVSYICENVDGKTIVTLKMTSESEKAGYDKEEDSLIFYDLLYRADDYSSAYVAMQTVGYLVEYARESGKLENSNGYFIFDGQIIDS